MNDRIIMGAGMAVSVPVLMYALWLFLHADPKLHARGGLIAAAGYAMLALTYTLAHQPVAVAISAAMAALYLWGWWNSGGGDGMKRRLKSWAAAFGPKLAPQGA